MLLGVSVAFPDQPSLGVGWGICVQYGNSQLENLKYPVSPVSRGLGRAVALVPHSLQRVLVAPSYISVSPENLHWELCSVSVKVY